MRPPTETPLTDRPLVRVPAGVARARALLPRLYAGDSIAREARDLYDDAMARDDLHGAAAALYAQLAAASIAQDADGANGVAQRLCDHGERHGLPAWASTGRQYLARHHLNVGHEDLALSDVVAAELLLDDVEPSVQLTTALNGIALTYSRLELYEDADRLYTWLDQVARRVDDTWTRHAMTHNRLLNQAAWALALIRSGHERAALDRLRIALAQTRQNEAIWQSDARFDFGALALFAELMIGECSPDDGRARLEALGERANAEPRSFARFALAHRRADLGDLPRARQELDAGVATLHAAEAEPVRSMLVWERARIAVLEDPSHGGLRDVWQFAQLAGEQIGTLRRRRVEALRDRLRIGRLRRDHNRIQQVSLEDPLTGAANRRRIDRERAALFDIPEGEWVTVAYIDIDEFKPVNDTHGHDVGDQVLRTIAELLRHCTRDSDLVGRYGGDEFVVVAHSCDPLAAHQLSTRILTSIRSHDWATHRPPVEVRVSLGIATADAGHHRLFPAADEALYAAKRGGRDRAETRVLPPVTEGAAADAVVGELTPTTAH